MSYGFTSMGFMFMQDFIIRDNCLTSAILGGKCLELNLNKKIYTASISHRFTSVELQLISQGFIHLA